jgi:hypothetical protein
MFFLLQAFSLPDAFHRASFLAVMKRVDQSSATTTLHFSSIFNGPSSDCGEP